MVVLPLKMKELIPVMIALQQLVMMKIEGKILMIY